MRQTGRVKFFNATKGYGFITPESGDKDIFVHITTVQKAGLPELPDGIRLTFDVLADSKGKGLQAVNLQLIEM